MRVKICVMRCARDGCSRSSASFGELLRPHRQAGGLAQRKLAERAGLSVHGIQKLERGVTHPSLDTAAANRGVAARS